MKSTAATELPFSFLCFCFATLLDPISGNSAAPTLPPTSTLPSFTISPTSLFSGRPSTIVTPVPGSGTTNPTPVPGGSTTNPTSVPGGSTSSQTPVPGGSTTNPTSVRGGTIRNPTQVPGGSTTNPLPVTGSSTINPTTLPGGGGGGGQNGAGGNGAGGDGGKCAAISCGMGAACNGMTGTCECRAALYTYERNSSRCIQDDKAIDSTFLKIIVPIIVIAGIGSMIAALVLCLVPSPISSSLAETSAVAAMTASAAPTGTAGVSPPEPAFNNVYSHIDVRQAAPPPTPISPNDYIMVGSTIPPRM